MKTGMNIIIHSNKAISALWNEFRLEDEFDFSDMTGIHVRRDLSSFEFKCSKSQRSILSKPQFIGTVTQIDEGLTKIEMKAVTRGNWAQMLLLLPAFYLINDSSHGPQFKITIAVGLMSIAFADSYFYSIILQRHLDELKKKIE